MSYQRYANAVKLHYLQYKESKKKENPTDYLKHLPSYLSPVPEYTTDSSMLFYDKENEELILAMRGLDFSSIKEEAPYVAAGGISGADIGGAVGNLVGGSRGRNRFSSTGKLIGAGIGAYLTGNKEVKSAMEIMVGGGQKELDEETDQIKQMGEYTSDLNKEVKKIRDIQQRFPDTEIVLAGHSRGGLKTNDLARMMELPAHLFNPATEYTDVLLKNVLPMVMDYTVDREFLQQQFSSIPSDKIETVGENVSVHRTPDDLVSMKYSDKFNIEPNPNVEYTIMDGAIGSHSIDQFISDELYKSVIQNRPIDNKKEMLQEILSTGRKPTSQPINQIDMVTSQPINQIDMVTGVPSFSGVNPYILCQSNPTLPFCEPYL